MTDQHPITPPEALVEQWEIEYWGEPGRRKNLYRHLSLHIATRAARWAADQELEACCKWLEYQLWRDGQSHEWTADLRAARRPEPPSLNEQALAEPQPQRDPLGTIHHIEPPQRDCAFIYLKIARHVTAANVRLAVGQHAAARDELNQALIAMEDFETTVLTVTTDD